MYKKIRIKQVLGQWSETPKHPRSEYGKGDFSSFSRTSKMARKHSRLSRGFSKWRRARAPSPPTKLSKKLEKYAPVFVKSNRIVSLVPSRHSFRAPFCLHLVRIWPFKRISRKQRLTIRYKLTLRRPPKLYIAALRACRAHYSVRIGKSAFASGPYRPRAPWIADRPQSPPPAS